MSDRRRILVVAPFAPSREAPHGGGRILAELLIHLAERHRLALLTLRERTEPAVDEDLRASLERLVEVERRPISRSLGRLVAERGRVLARLRRDPAWVVASEVARARRELATLVADWQPDLVQLETLALGGYANALDRRAVPVVLVHYDAAPDGREEPTAAWARHARRTFARVDALVVFTASDRKRAMPFAPRAVHVIRPGMDLPPPAAREDESGVLFVGAFLHEPNVEAAKRLVDKIHPLVRARIPDVELTIVGADPPSDVFARAGVRITGRVPDVTPFVEGAAVVVAPLTLGAGVRIKVLDALARGKAIVATSRAVEGLAVVDGVHVLVRDSDRAFAEAVADLLEDPASRARLGRAARVWAEEQLAWDAALDRYDELYAGLLER